LKTQANEWDPDILIKEIFNFIKKQNMIRKIPLKTAHRKDKKDLLIQMKRIISVKE